MVERCTDRVGTTTTVSVGAGLTRATSVAIVACNPVGFGRWLTDSSAVVADAGFQAIGGFRAANRGCRGAGSSLTGLAVGAEAAVVTGGAGEDGVGAPIGACACARGADVVIVTEAALVGLVVAVIIEAIAGLCGG